jgi:translation initiation factor 3 subunit B
MPYFIPLNKLIFFKLENGYQIRDFKGQTLYESPLERFKLFSWRPRPPTLVPRDQQRKIRRTLREYSREFEAEDEAEAAGASQELLTLRRRLLEEWYTWRKMVGETLLSERRDRTRDVNGEDADEIIEEWVEEVVEEKEEVVTD